MYGICAINLSGTNVLNVCSVLDSVFGAKWLNSKVKALIQHATLPGLDGAPGSCIPDDDTMFWCSTDWVTAFHLQRSPKPHFPTSWGTRVRPERNTFCWGWRALMEMWAPRPAISVATPRWQSQWGYRASLYQAQPEGLLKGCELSPGFPRDCPCVNSRVEWGGTLSGCDRLGTSTPCWALTHCTFPMHVTLHQHLSPYNSLVRWVLTFPLTDR